MSSTDPRGGPTPDPFVCPACAAKDVRCNATLPPHLATNHSHTCRVCLWEWPLERIPDRKAKS